MTTCGIVVYMNNTTKNVKDMTREELLFAKNETRDDDEYERALEELRRRG
jgi:hypothetical protein